MAIEWKKYLSYNPDTGDITWLKICGRGRVGATAGALEKKGYVRLQIKGYRILAHRVAWYFIYGSWPKKQIDHINGVKSDNRASNLRQATNSQNQANRGKNKNNTSGHKGVTWAKDRNKWRAHAGMGGKKYYLGSFDRIEDAVQAARAGAKRLFGEFSSD
jgi:hypothetical protein